MSNYKNTNQQKETTWWVPQFVTKMFKNGPQNEPRLSQNGPKWSPNDHFVGVNEHLGSQKGPWLTKLDHKVTPRWPQERPKVQKGAQNGAKRVPRRDPKWIKNGSKNGSFFFRFLNHFLINFWCFGEPKLDHFGDNNHSTKRKQPKMSIFKKHWKNQYNLLISWCWGNHFWTKNGSSFWKIDDQNVIIILEQNLINFWSIWGSCWGHFGTQNWKKNDRGNHPRIVSK